MEEKQVEGTGATAKYAKGGQRARDVTLAFQGIDEVPR